METIFALATAPGRAGIAVVRISGPGAETAARGLAGTLPRSRTAGLRRLSWRGEMLDEALVLFFEPGRSFTGEAVVELHLHGARAVIQAVMQALSEVQGLRIAKPGEFTRRALENGKLDLAQVEGLADLIDAETEAQRRQALRVFSGAIGKLLESWRFDLLRASALLEAMIDFSDEGISDDVSFEVERLIDQVFLALAAEVRGFAAAERVREGFEVAIVGRPNSGKSTLLNMLAGREAAITSEYAGTTRDVIEVQMDLGGLPVTFLDTAGLRDASDPVEAIGIDRGLKRAEAADIRVFLLDDGTIPLLDPKPGDLIVQGKVDLGGILPTAALGVSGKTGTGVRALMEEISRELEQRAGAAGSMTRQRHRIALEAAIEGLESARIAVREERVEVAAYEMRRAIRSMEALVGRVDVEQLLDEIFSSFCIGK